MGWGEGGCMGSEFNGVGNIWGLSSVGWGGGGEGGAEFNGVGGEGGKGV